MDAGTSDGSIISVVQTPIPFPAREREAVAIADGAVWLKGALSLDEQLQLLAECRSIMDGPAGGYVPTVRGGGKMHVRMTCLGRHWNPLIYKYEETRADFDRAPVAPVPNRWPSLMALGEVLFGRLGWWPPTQADAASTIIGAMTAVPRVIPGRPAERPSRFADAGITLLRTSEEHVPEIWCRCDGGPHGFLSIAAHAHADALSVEVRYGGVEILADPGTYCYHGEPEWRSYFRSTIAHNTVELDGQNQSGDGGPFLWLRQADAREIEVLDDGQAGEWTAEHDGYLTLDPPARHRRRVRLDRAARTLDITDEIARGGHDVCVAFHLGPDIQAEFDGTTAVLRWPDTAVSGAARLELPHELAWSLHHGETSPILGWYSCGLGRRVPAVTFLGRARSMPGTRFTTRLNFFDVGELDAGEMTSSALKQSSIPWGALDSLAGTAGSHSEAR